MGLNFQYFSPIEKDSESVMAGVEPGSDEAKKPAFSWIIMPSLWELRVVTTT